MRCTPRFPRIGEQQTRGSRAALGDAVSSASCRSSAGMQPMSNDPAELLLNSTWRPTLSVTGVDGIPPVAERRQRAAAR